MPPHKQPAVSEEFRRLLDNHVRGYIKRERESGRRMSQERLASELGYSRYALRNWLGGESRISANDLGRLCARIGLNPFEQIELYRVAGYTLPEDLHEQVASNG